MAQETAFRTAVSGFNRTDVMQYIEKLMGEIKEQKKQIFDLENELAAFRAALAASENKARTAADNACENCEKAKIAEAQLGATMLDAKRFSELLLKDANDRAAAVLNNALGAVDASADTAGALALEVKRVRESFGKTLGDLYGELSAVILQFNDFRDTLEKRGYDFVYHTDFALKKDGDET